MSLPFRFLPTLRRVLWVAALAVATAPAWAAPDQLDCTPPQPAPSAPGVAQQTQRFAASDGTCLQAYSWQPATGPVRGVVAIVHGLRDHARRYAVLAEALVAGGFAVVAMDHRGHGNSGGARQRFDSIEQLMSDVDLAVADARRRMPGVPVFMFGHSMGGLVATTYALVHPQALKGVVLSGPALKLGAEATAAKRVTVQVLGRVWPSLPAQKVDDSLFVRTAAAKAAQAGDPLIVHEDLPAGSVLAFLHGIESARERFGKFSTPLLALHGAADQSTDPQGSRDLVELAAGKDKSLRIVPSAAHDLLHEPEAGMLVREIVAWVTERVSAPTR